MMNTEVIGQQWDRLLDAMTDGARDLAVPLMGVPMGVAVGMIARPEAYSPQEIRLTGVIYLIVVVTLLTVGTVKHWRRPDTAPANQSVALAQEIFANATALYEGAVAINETTTELLRASREQPNDTDQP